ncbi:MAG: type II toxin-antitoxin system VapC family toxin [Gemmatimonas sp.]
MILIDTNIVMYAAGAPHPHKAPSARLLEAVARGEVDAMIDAELLQEILHRYRFIGRWDDGRKVYDLTRRIFETIVPITVEILDQSRALMDEYPKLIARDALHAAVAIHEQCDMCSYDSDFDVVRQFKRIEPSA